MHTDVGLHALDIIHKILLIDAEWTSRGNRDCTWWAHRLAQRVSASSGIDSRGLLISRIRTSVPVLENVQMPPAQVLCTLAEMNRLAIGSALVYRMEERLVEAVLAHNVHEDTVELRSREIASNQLIMLAQCEAFADEWADFFNADVVQSPHPLMGRRLNPDGMLSAIEQHYVPLGYEPSRFAGASEFKTIEAESSKMGAFSLGGDENGINVEMPFGENATTLIEVDAAAEHPQFGSGLKVFTSTSWTGTELEVAALANGLNTELAEAFEVQPALGAWGSRVIDGRRYLAHARFVPNADATLTRPLDAALAAVNMANWVDRLLFPNLGDRHAAEIVLRRLEGRQQ